MQIFTLFFVEYTDTRNPQDYCDDKESPSEKTIFLNENRKLEETKNSIYHQPSPSVHHETHTHSDSNDQFAASSGTYKLIRDFDLNQLPFAEDK